MAVSSASVLVAGSLTVDTIEAQAGASSRLGGVVTYASLTFIAHGLQTIAVFRAAERDRRLADRLSRPGLQVRWLPSPATTRFVQRAQGDARQQWMPCAAPPIDALSIKQYVEAAGHVHFGPLHPDDLDERVFELEGLRSRVVSLDLQGYVRGLQGTRVTAQVSERLRAALGVARYAKASHEELALVCAGWGIDEQRLMQATGLQELVVTSGSLGGYVRTSSGRVHRYEAGKAARVVDTTGAGDVFFAAFLARRVHVGDELEAACAHAARISASHVAGEWLRPGELDVME